MSDAHEDPPVDAAVVGTAASMDPSGTTLVAALVAGAAGALVGAGRRVVGTFWSGRPDADPPGGEEGGGNR